MASLASSQPFWKAPGALRGVAARAASAAALVALVGLTCVGAVGAMLATDGNPAAVAAPVVAVVGLWLLVRLPVRLTALGMVFLLLVVDYPSEVPYSNLWQSPFHGLGRMLFVNLSALTNISALRFPLFDLMVVVLLAIRSWRVAHDDRRDDSGVPKVRALDRALYASLVAVAALSLWGTATGGSFNEGLWQLRHLLVFPAAAFLFLGSLKGTEAELRLVARLAVAAALVKSLCGIYFIYFVVRPRGLVVEFTSSHSDTLLFVSVLAGWVAWFFEQPTRAKLARGLWWVPIVVWGMVLNDRRLAYVSLAGALLAIYFMQPPTRLKRSLQRLVVLLVPVAVLYTAVGWNRTGTVWGTAQLLKSLVVGDPAQAGADYRDMENANVISTWSSHPIVPLGFGHKFHEPLKLPDISHMMPTYQYHPHNSLLWMWAIGGVFGFTLIFGPWVVGLLLAARAYRRLTRPFERAAMLTAIALIISHLNQVYGDMGTRSHFGSVLGALAVALAAKLAVRSGAWARPA